MKIYRAQTPQYLALTNILHKLRKTSTPQKTWEEGGFFLGSASEHLVFVYFLAQNVERQDRNLGQGQDPKEVVKEVNKCREVAEEAKGQIEGSQGHKC